MNKSLVLQKTREFVQEKMKGDGSAHDWWHVARVVDLAKKIGRKEGVDLFVCELGALLHDIADWKFTGGDLKEGPKLAREWLESQKVDANTIETVVEIVEHISYRGGTNKHVMQTAEGKVVQDADRIDGLGAIGIARTFAVGGNLGKEIYNPKFKPRTYKNFAEYNANYKQSSTINHFYEKILLVKDKLNTKTGKRIAEHRHTYMEQFLDEFYAEWDGTL